MGFQIERKRGIRREVRRRALLHLRNWTWKEVNYHPVRRNFHSTSQHTFVGPSSPIKPERTIKHPYLDLVLHPQMECLDSDALRWHPQSFQAKIIAACLNLRPLVRHIKLPVHKQYRVVKKPGSASGLFGEETFGKISKFPTKQSGGLSGFLENLVMLRVLLTTDSNPCAG
ncbi:hypothetical protein CROQUDRAFT_97671 [Cronartium quercuum f. sp. fusiforme G11]|uniref:Uncharacterized protein n=1 Tax=Cronartium quercuum f. sp. fusiforme G11 TaxID=708437 RepID=A0A9P6T9A1_9BASI|nr:hypothetical protein CROQUDRAFT_97671 [Cronartium quercuum f. sp. fusiforme G11]